MTITTVEGLRSAFYLRCDSLTADPTYHGWFRTAPGHDGSPHLEMGGSYFCFVVTERGKEYERRRTLDPDEVLYWLVSTVVFDLACKFELENRRSNQDRWFIYLEGDVLNLHRSWTGTCTDQVEFA